MLESSEGGAFRWGLTALLALSWGCGSSDFHIGYRVDASPNHPVSDVGSDTGTEAGAPDPFTGGSPAVALGKVDFSRAVASTVAAGDNSIALFADRGMALVDLTDPTNPLLGPEGSTDGQVVAVEYDEARGIAYAADATGKLYLFGARTVDGFGKLYEAFSASLASKVVGMSRLGSTLYLLTGDAVVPVTFTFTNDVPDGSSFGAAIALGGSASLIAAGGDTVYVAMKTSSGGELQAWSAPAGGSPAELGQYALPAEPRTLLAKGSKVLAGVAGVGLAVVDFGNPQAPVQLALDRSMYDLSFARLFGRTLAVGLDRKLVATVDLSDFAAPRVLTVDQGALPQYLTVVGGVLFRGTGTSATVANVPPTVSVSVPQITANSFPLHGQVPVTFGKPIDAATATSVLVTLTCGGTRISGNVIVSAERTVLAFLPDDLLPASSKCTLDLSGVKDAEGQGVAGGSSVTVTTAAQPSQAMTIAGSKYAHTPDGQFTDFDAAAGSNNGEWSDVTPAKGVYTYFYGDFKDGQLNILNDWFFDGDKIDPDCYNEFYVWTGGGSEQWTIRAFADQKVTVLKNGVTLDPATSGVSGSAGYGPSPNLKDPHTIYELQIPAQAGAWGVRLHDPGPTYACSRLSSEPTNLQGTLGVGSTTSGVTIDPTVKPQAPAAPTLLAPADQLATGTVMPTLAWTAASNDVLGMLEYQVQISKVSTFKGLVWNVSTGSTSYTVPAGVLGAGATYYWRIVASNAAGQATSSAFSFSTSQPVGGPDAGTDAAPAREAGVLDASNGDLPPSPSDLPPKFTDAAPDAPADLPSGAGDVGSDLVDAPEDRSVAVDSGGQRGLTVTFADSGGSDAAVPGQGTVISQPKGIDCTNGDGTCSALFSVGSTVYLLASAATGWHFVSWGGDCQTDKASQAPVSITDGQAPLNCTILFEPDLLDGGGADAADFDAVTPDAATGTGGSGGAGGAGGSGGAIDVGQADGAAGTGGNGGAIDGSGTAGTTGGVVLFTGAPSALAGDGSYVYVGQSDGSSIRRIPLGATGVGLDTLIVPSVTVAADGLAVGPTYVYWISGDVIMRAPKAGLPDGGAPEVAVQVAATSFLLGSNSTDSADATYLFWATGTLASANIYTLALGSDTLIQVATGVALTQGTPLRADSTNIYWVGTVGTTNGVYRSSLGAASPTQVGTDTVVTGLGVGTVGPAYLVCQQVACTLRQFSASGTLARELGGFPISLTGVSGAADTIYVYGATDAYSTNLSTKTQVMSNQISGTPYASTQGFFWFNSSGEVRKALPSG